MNVSKEFTHREKNLPVTMFRLQAHGNRTVNGAIRLIRLEYFSNGFLSLDADG